MRPLADCRLYAFVDAAYLHGREPIEVCRQLCDGGADLVQLRAKDWPIDQVERCARQLLPVCEAAGVWFVVNDYPAVAETVGAPLAHLGQEDFFEAGGRLGSALLTLRSSLRVGLSSHAPAQAERAIAAGAAYLAVGPVYATGTKPGRVPVTLAYVQWAAANVAIPWFAIGGITLENLSCVLAAGARRVCVVSAILNAPRITAACQEFKRRLTAFPLNAGAGLG